MKNWKSSKSVNESLVYLLLVLWGLGTITSIQAQSSGQTLNIHGRGFGNVIGATTSGFIIGAGVLNGTTQATFTDSKASGGGLLGVDTATLSYVAALVINTKRGNVTTQDVGIFDTANGKFSSVSKVTGGTGRFAGAKGFLFFHGDVFPDGRFASEVSGEIELP
jgi:hypothetical protein